MNTEDLLHPGHYQVEEFTQTMTTKQWKEILLAGLDRIFYRGELRDLQVKKMGYGVVKVSKKPLTVPPPNLNDFPL